MSDLRNAVSDQASNQNAVGAAGLLNRRDLPPLGAVNATRDRRSIEQLLDDDERGVAMLGDLINRLSALRARAIGSVPDKNEAAGPEYDTNAHLGRLAQLQSVRSSLMSKGFDLLNALEAAL
jgi:hypothetical protein